MTSRPSTAAPILAVLAIVVPLLLLGAYVGGYLSLCEYRLGKSFDSGASVRLRFYETEWQRSLFAPAAWMEGLLTGMPTVIMKPLDK